MRLWTFSEPVMAILWELFSAVHGAKAGSEYKENIISQKTLYNDKI